MTGATQADPFNRDPASSYGVAVAVAPGVRRVLARNPSPMTFTGTASYLVGEGQVAVIDPGPDDPAHHAALLDALGGATVSAILVTHSHLDHSAGASALRAATGAPVLAFGPHGAGLDARFDGAIGLGGGEGADTGFAPDRRLEHGEAVEAGACRLVALHTPGHLSNHLCFALAGAGTLFTGDHVMTWASSLVSPPDGDMAAYMASLRLLQGRDDRTILPSHGHPSRDPQRLIGWLIAHRQAREAQIVGALRDGPATAAEIARRLYADVDPRLLPAATRNVLAHLLALVDADRAVCDAPPSAGARFRLR
jgi:hydroxyacylglutathione hydrolase